MNRVVFFGMNGGYSAAALAALAGSGLRPVLVVRGEVRPEKARTPKVELSRPGASWLDRLGLTRRGASSAPRDADVFEASAERDRETRFHGRDLAEAAHELGIDVLSTTDANVLRARLAIARAEPDAFAVAGFPHLLAPDLLALPKRGGLNLHPGRLPDERGPVPIFWALREGRTRITCTVHVLDRGEDTGDVVSTTEVTFEPGLDIEEVYTRCARSSAPQLIRALRSLLAGELVRMPQPREGAARRPRPTFRDGRLDPKKSAVEVFTFVRGCARVHSLFSEHGGDRFFVRDAVSFDPAATLPFEYMLTGDRMVLRCNPGVVELVLKADGAIFTAEYHEHED